LGEQSSRERSRGSLPRSPTGRVPQWVVDETLGQPRPAVPWRTHTATSPLLGSRRGWATRRRGWRGISSALVVVLLVAAAVWAASTGRLPSVTAARPAAPPPAGAAAPGAAAPGADHPTAGREAAERPLGTPAAVPITSGSYRFTFTSPEQSFVAYDPCRPIHYVVRPEDAPAGTGPLLAEAIARVSAATGLVFIDDGVTREAPTAQRLPYQPEVYGDRWAPVLIAWVTPTENPDLAGDIAGQAGSAAVGLAGGPRVLVTGQMELDTHQLAEILNRPGGREIVLAILQHELAHLVGLDHVNDSSQLMHPQTSPGVPDFAAGDRTGLSILGRGPCVPDL
jgi:hypothetical protein